MLKSRIKYNTASFVTSAPDISRLPADTGIEVAFAGRSNAGKSSALNTLTDQKLARIIEEFKAAPGSENVVFN